MVRRILTTHAAMNHAVPPSARAALDSSAGHIGSRVATAVISVRSNICGGPPVVHLVDRESVLSPVLINFTASMAFIWSLAAVPNSAMIHPESVAG